jgi:hypothetical protein
MSIATLKRKTVGGGNPRLDPISGVGTKGFSLNGGCRNIGAVGQFRMVSNVTRTPFRGTLPMGHGGFNGEYYKKPSNSGSCSTNDDSIIKHSSLTTAGLIDEKYKWTKSQYPRYWVKDDDNSYRQTKTQGQLTGAKTWAAGACNFEKAANDDPANVWHCNTKCYYWIGGKRKFLYYPYTKFLNTDKVQSQGAYITAGGVARQNRLPTPACIQPYPMMLCHNKSGCDVNPVLWQQAQAQGLLPPDYLKCNPIDYVNCKSKSSTTPSLLNATNAPPIPIIVTNNGFGSYAVNGVANATITLTRGITYTFNINATGHPFHIQTSGNGYNASNAYVTGVTGSGTQVGTVTFAVPLTAPNTLFYQCQFHAAMFGQINIIG